MKTVLVMVSAVIVWAKPGRGRHIINNDKVVGGVIVTDIRTAPYMINIQVQDPYYQNPTWEPYAAGTIFTPLYVITACNNVVETDEVGNIVSLVESYPLKYWRFVAGTANLANMDKSHQFRTPVYITHHPNCQVEKNGWSYLRNDVALARMTEPFELNDYVKLVEFFGFSRPDFEAGVSKIILSQNFSTVCKVAGWGTAGRISILEEFGDANRTITVMPKLRDREKHGTGTSKEKDEGHRLKSFEVYPTHDCFLEVVLAIATGLGPYAYLMDDTFVEQYRQILQQQLCALSKFSNESTCYGDSGSGLVCNGLYIGVTSWGVGCGAGAPEVFQSLPELLGWLKNEVCTVRSCQDAWNLHDKCDPLDPDYMEKCQAPITKSPDGNALRPTSYQWLTIAVAYLASNIN